MPLVIAGERSGVGKTTVTLTLLASLCRRGVQVQSFKVGPDYIDPMFHQHVTGRCLSQFRPSVDERILRSGMFCSSQPRSGLCPRRRGDGTV